MPKTIATKVLVVYGRYYTHLKPPIQIGTIVSIRQAYGPRYLKKNYMVGRRMVRWGGVDLRWSALLRKELLNYGHHGPFPPIHQSKTYTGSVRPGFGRFQCYDRRLVGIGTSVREFCRPKQRKNAARASIEYSVKYANHCPTSCTAWVPKVHTAAGKQPL